MSKSRRRIQPKRPVQARVREVKVYGVNAVLALWRYRKDAIIRVFVREDRVQELRPLLRYCAEKKLAYRIVSDEELERVSGSKHHEGVSALAREKAPVAFGDLLNELGEDSNPCCLVYLEGVANPHNVGAILRTCAHFGVRALLVDGEQELPLSGSLLRISEGGGEIVDIVKVESLRDAVLSLSNHRFHTIGTSPNEKLSVFERSMTPRTLFLFGAEDKGLSRPSLKLANSVVTIPGMNPSLSLNVATSVGICLGEYWRQVS